jgi:pyridoxamine 5'-phosphate oxidase
MSIDIAGLRVQYGNEALDIDSSHIDPLQEFQKWIEAAVHSKCKEPNAMTLATVDKEGRPDARIVLLKEVTNDGFVFYTNYNSKKGKQMFANAYVSAVFVWLDLERQVRIRGKVELYDTIKSTKYFQSRPRESQIAAWASPQSTIIEDRQILESLIEETKVVFENDEILPKPAHWGGYVITPYEIEFWQGRRSRLHDRILYSLQEGSWHKKRLAP